jgi:hypothetical protein
MGFGFDCGIESKGASDDEDGMLSLEGLEFLGKGLGTEGLPFFG